MKSCSPLSQSCIFSHLTHHPMLCVCVCGSSYNQHCSPAFWQAFGADKAGSTSILPLTVVPCASHSHRTHHPMLCVCVWFQLQSTLLCCFLASLWGWQSRLHIHLCALAHFWAFLCIHSPLFLSLSPSFSLTFSFLNLSFLLSPFSIFLSYFLLSQSFSLTFSFFYLSLFMCPRLFHSQFNI